MKPLRSWRFPGKTEYSWLIIEETMNPGEVAIVIERQDDSRREWVSRDTFTSLSDLIYQIEWNRIAKDQS